MNVKLHLYIPNNFQNYKKNIAVLLIYKNPLIYNKISKI